MISMIALRWSLVGTPVVTNPSNSDPDSNHKPTKLNSSATTKPLHPSNNTSLLFYKKLLEVICIVFANALTYFIVKTMSDWTVPYVMETLQFTNKEAVDVSFWIEVSLIYFSLFVIVFVRFD